VAALLGRRQLPVIEAELLVVATDAGLLRRLGVGGVDRLERQVLVRHAVLVELLQSRFFLFGELPAGAAESVIAGVPGAERGAGAFFLERGELMRLIGIPALEFLVDGGQLVPFRRGRAVVAVEQDLVAR